MDEPVFRMIQNSLELGGNHYDIRTWEN